MRICILGTIIIFTLQIKNFSSQNCFCSNNTTKNWLASVDLIQTNFIPGQCKQTQPNFCLSTQTDRASSWMGLSKSHCSKQARWQSHPIAMASSVCLCPTASPVQHSHKWHGRGSPWSCSLHAPSHPNQRFATRERHFNSSC